MKQYDYEYWEYYGPSHVYRTDIRHTSTRESPTAKLGRVQRLQICGTDTAAPELTA